MAGFCGCHSRSPFKRELHRSRFLGHFRGFVDHAATARRREVQVLIDELLGVARGLTVEDLRALLEVARRLQRR